MTLDSTQETGSGRSYMKQSVNTRMGLPVVYELKCLRDQYWKLGPMAWLMDAYLVLRRSDSDKWINGGAPVFDHLVADSIGATSEIVADWRELLSRERLIHQHKTRSGGWLIRPASNYEELLDEWLMAWRRLRYLREALWS
jgi:hypothetical protein